MKRTFARHPLWPAVLAVLVALWPAVATADTGIPMLAVVWPLSWLAFPIIVALEAVVAKRVLELSTKESFSLALSANAWSTLVGIPLTWVACVLIEMVTGLFFNVTRLRPRGIGEVIVAPFLAAWLPPSGGAMKMWWVYGAAGILCVPFFFASVYVETRVANRRAPEERARRWAWRANALTYGLSTLALVVAAILSALRSR